METPEKLPFLPVPIAAKKLKVSTRSLYRWIEQGKIKYYTVAGERGDMRKLVMIGHVQEYLKTRDRAAE